MQLCSVADPHLPPLAPMTATVLRRMLLVESFLAEMKKKDEDGNIFITFNDQMDQKTEVKIKKPRQDFLQTWSICIENTFFKSILGPR